MGRPVCTSALIRHFDDAFTSPRMKRSSPLASTSPAAPLASAAQPIVGRERELAVLAALQAQVENGIGGVLLCSGDGGIGKTRLITELAGTTRAAGWHVMSGRAYALENAIPYAPFADACEPALTAMDGNTLLRLTRGDRVILSALAPSLSGGGDHRNTHDRLGGASAAEQQVRLHAGTLQLLSKLAEREPVLLVIENLQWADSASVELFHFLSRQASAIRLLIVGTWNETERELPETLRTTVRSLRAMGVARDMRLEPLSREALGRLVTHRFRAEGELVSGFVHRLFDVTRGNPFFAGQILEELISQGTLHESHGVWLGWNQEDISLPASVRDVLHARLERLSPQARQIVELIAVTGTATDHEMLRIVCSGDDVVEARDGAVAGASIASSEHSQSAGSTTPDDRLLTALDELRRHGIIVERLEHHVISYDVAHPMMRQALTDAVGLARERLMHARIARALEQAYIGHGARFAERHAEQIAAHWRLADPKTNARETVRWLLLAGEQAKLRFARREAAIALHAALDRADEFPEAIDSAVVPELLDELSRLYRRLGEYHQVIAMCTRACALATASGNHSGVAVAERRLGLAYEGLGQRANAVAHFDAGIASAVRADDLMLLARIRLAKGDSLQALGMLAEARQETALALELAEQSGDVGLLARTHRVLLKLYTWSGPAHRAWSHARSAVELAERSGGKNVAWSAHWSAAVLAGFTTNVSALQHHLAHATQLANELNSPLLQLRTAEIDIEYRAGRGEWDRALVDGERAIVTARALNQTSLLARLAFWVGGVHLQRGNVNEAKRLFDEAWVVSGAENVDVGAPFEVHGVLPAYTARVTWFAAAGDYARALELGRAAIAMADQTGYVAWAVYRLVPALAEAASALDHRELLMELHTRLTRDSVVLSHTIGRGWAAAIAGEIARLDTNTQQAIGAFQEAIAVLESVPFPFDAARMRLRLAHALNLDGDTREAATEALSALQVFDALGAAPAANEARELLRRFGARVPVVSSAPTFSELTDREREILFLVAKRMSNKAIGAQLSISARTVGTHLANIYDKVGVRDRTGLGDMVRSQGTPGWR